MAAPKNETTKLVAGAPQRCLDVIFLCRIEACQGNCDVDRAEWRACGVEQRRCDADDAGCPFLTRGGEAGCPDSGELLTKRLDGLQRRRCGCLEASARKVALLKSARHMRQDRLAAGGRVKWREIAEPHMRHQPRRAEYGGNNLGLIALELIEGAALAGLPGQIGQDPFRVAGEVSN